MNSIAPTPDSRPLRILILLNLDWNPHLGAARVYVELAEQWKAAGHTVEHFSFSEAFPRPPRSPREFSLRRLAFPHRAAAFVQANASRFDVVDALIGSIGSAKRKLGFRGLLVARSVGSHRLYDRFERSVHVRWPGRNKGSIAGRLFYGALNRWTMAVSDAALRHADLINVPNTEEATFLNSEVRPDLPVIVQPYGLTDEQRRALSGSAASAADRQKNTIVSFVGMWSPRKGSAIWGEIIRRVHQKIANVRFRFLGTMVPPETVLADVGQECAPYIETVPEFSPKQLPALLADCSVGAFPSYVEGFGLAVIEQLASGIPIVAFDQGGPRDLLRDLPELLVPTGSIEDFASALVRTLQLAPSDYEQLQRTAINTAARYGWSGIAQATIEQYQNSLSKI